MNTSTSYSSNNSILCSTERYLFAVNTQHSREKLKESLLLREGVTSDVHITKPRLPRSKKTCLEVTKIGGKKSQR